MRIKLLKAVPGHEVGDYLTVDDEAVAKQYLSLGYAEEAPEEADNDLAVTVKGLIGDIYKAVREEFAAQSKANGGRGPRVEAGESEHDRRKSLGHQMQLIGIACNEETPHPAREEANNVLKNLYGSAFRPWTKDDENASTVAKSSAIGKGSTQVESSGPLGGYGIYPEYSMTLYKLAVESTIFASRARKQPMASNSFLYPKLDQTGTQAAGQPGILGGILLWWQGEAAAINKTNAQLKQGELKTGKLQGYTQFSMETISDDAVGLEAQITALVKEGVGWYVDYATLTGDGVNKPLGVVNANATIQYTRKGGAGTTTLDFTDLTGMKRRLLPQFRKEAFWIVTLTAEDALWNIVDSTGRPLFLPNATGTPDRGSLEMNVGAGNQPVLGLPYEVTEKTPVYGSTGDLMLVAPQGYLLGERMGLEIAASNAPGFLSGLMTYRFLARVAGQPILDKPYTLIDGTNQASTFVALK